MPIEITPQGEYIDSVTGNPVNMPPSGTVMREGEIPMSIEIDGQTRMMTPSEIARLDPRSVVREGEMSQMNSMMPQVDEKTLVEIDFLMKQFNLSMDEAIEAVARTRDTGIRPEEFSGARESAMRQQTPMIRPSMPSSGMGALPSAPPPRPVQRMDSDRTQDMEMQKYNMGT